MKIKDTTCKNLWDVSKAVLRQKCIAAETVLKIKE